MQVQPTSRTPQYPERFAAMAAGLGFVVSLVGLLAYVYAGHHPLLGASFRSSLEASFVFLWPSAILMLGAQSLQGQIVLFLLSASLNAGYFGAIALLVYVVRHKLQTAAQRATPALATARNSSAHSLRQPVATRQPS